MAEWIKVSERLPDPAEYDWVLANIMFNEDGSYGVPNVAEYRNGEWWDFFDNKLSDLDITVTHWQPLPLPPETEKGANEKSHDRRQIERLEWIK